MVDFAQLIIGPPGAGKTTYCDAMQQLLTSLERNTLTINLDFANDWKSRISYRDTLGSEGNYSIMVPDIDVRRLITVQKVMEEHGLGPNGALLYCQRYLLSEIEWILNEIEQAKKKKELKSAYFLMDCPGQVELYSLDDSLAQILDIITDKGKSMRVSLVHLTDANLCYKPHDFLSAALLSLTAQLHLSFPFVNCLTKIDLLSDEKMEFDLEYFCRCEDLNYLVASANRLTSYIGDKHTSKKKKLVELQNGIVELLEDYGLNSFIPITVNHPESMLYALEAIDRGNGFCNDPSRSRTDQAI